MKHAIEVLEERRCELSKLIRSCRENSDRAMSNINTITHELKLREINRALEALKAMLPLDNR